MADIARAFKDGCYYGATVRRCHYCALKMRRDQATVDHKVPHAHGGPTHSSNFVLACKPCNELKGTTSYEAFKQLMLPTKRRREERYGNR